MQATLFALEGLPEIHTGDKLARMIIDALGQTQLQSGDIVAISHKIVSKAEGRLFPPDAVKVSDKARRLAERTGKTPEQT